MIDGRLLTPLRFFNPFHPVPSNLFFPAIDVLSETDAICRWRRITTCSVRRVDSRMESLIRYLAHPGKWGNDLFVHLV